MTTQTIARPTMTALAAELYAQIGAALDQAMRQAEEDPGPDTQQAVEVCALAYDLVATEYEL